MEYMNYQALTFLPCELRQKAEKSTSVLSIITPHKGTVYIEITQEDTGGLFRTASRVDKNMSRIWSEISSLQLEATDYLIREWKKTLTN